MDTINVLSNAWTMDDSHNVGYNASNLPATTVSLTNALRDAIETSVNAAISVWD